MLLNLPRDFLKRLSSSRHQLVEVVKRKYVWLVVERHIDSDDVLGESAKDGDYEGHGGGSRIDKTTFIHPYPV